MSVGQGPPSAVELEAATELHHQLFTGLLLGLAGHHGMTMAASLVERTFRQQHDERFLPGLDTLGLTQLPPALACARFIVLSNRAGGLDVQYHEEGPRKAWVRYPPPRWAYEGPAICALDNSVSEAFLRAFHARCGASLGNPRLRFVCVGMTTNGDPGLIGYFEEMARPLADDERLALRLGEPFPRFHPGEIPDLPWSASRMPVARRNYAVRYIQVMLPLLRELLGDQQGESFATHVCRLVGLQAYRETAVILGVSPGGRDAFLHYLRAVNSGTGNEVAAPGAHGQCRLARFRPGTEHATFRAWSGLIAGALGAHDPALRLAVSDTEMAWTIA